MTKSCHAIGLTVLLICGCGFTPGGVDIWQAITAGDKDAISRYADAGGDLNAVNDEYESLLIYACENDHQESFHHLLELGADPNFVTKSLHTAVNCAAGKESSSWLEAVLEHGGNPNVVADDNLGTGMKARSPLEWAAGYGRLENVKLLADKGADVNAADAFGDTPLVHATSRLHFDVVLHLLLEQSADYGYKHPGRTSFVELMKTRKLDMVPDPEMKKYLIRVREWLSQRGIPFEDEDGTS